MPDKTTKVFRDPVHDLIYLGPDDQFIRHLIDTKEFQRLRRIRQLGLSHLVYPGAEHTRFTHSLGVFNFARRMMDRLKDRHPEHADDIREQEKAVKAAALLHDVGHGPFSHVFERVFPEHFKHEKWSCEILLDTETEVGKKLSEEVDLDPWRVVGLISEKASQWFPNAQPPDHPYLRDIVSSQLDADRMDYLLRDSMMTGSRYGQFDSEWILNNLAIGEIEWANRTLKTLCLDAGKGLGAIVGLLFARLLMLQYVYYHKTTRAYEAELVCTLRLACCLSSQLPASTPAHVRTLLEAKGEIDTKTYLMLDDEMMWWTLRQWAVWESLPGGTDRERVSALKRHALRLVRRNTPWRSVDLDQEKALHLKKWLSSRDEDDPAIFECCLDAMEDLPYKNLQYLAAKSEESEEEDAFFGEIFVIKKDGSPARLSRVEPSPMKPVLDAFTEKAQLFRLHYDEDFPKKSREFSGLLTKFGVC